MRISLALAVLGCAGTCPALAQTASYSTTYQINNAHSGGIDFSTPFAPPLARAWSRDFGGPVSYPVVAEGLVFVSIGVENTGARSLLVALDLTTGKVVWEKALNTGYLAYDNGRLFFTDSSGPLQAFAAKTGKPLWSTSLPGGQFSFSFVPVAHAGYVYTGATGEGTTMYQVDEATGAVGWMQEQELSANTGATIGPGALYFAVACDVPSYTLKSGTLNWNYNSGCDGGGGGGVAAYYRGEVYAPGLNFGNAGVVLNARTGTLVGSLSGTIPAFYGNAAYATSGGTVTATNIATGNLLWEFAVDETFIVPPVVVNGTVFALSGSGKLFALNGTTGALLQRLNPGLGKHGSSSGASLAAGQGVLVVPSGNTLVAYAPKQ